MCPAGELTIVHPPGKLLLKRPASELEITSPALRRFAFVILQVDGELLAVEFDFVYRRKKLLGSRQRGILRAVQAVFLASSITYIPAIRLGRRLAAEFAAALLAAGAHEMKATRGQPRGSGPFLSLMGATPFRAVVRSLDRPDAPSSVPLDKSPDDILELSPTSADELMTQDTGTTAAA